MKQTEQEEWNADKQNHREHGGYHSTPPTSGLLHHVGDKKAVKKPAVLLRFGGIIENN